MELRGLAMAADLARDLAVGAGKHGEDASLPSGEIEGVAEAGAREPEVGFDLVDVDRRIEHDVARVLADAEENEAGADRRRRVRAGIELLGRRRCGTQEQSGGGKESHPSRPEMGRSRAHRATATESYAALTMSKQRPTSNPPRQRFM